MSESVRRVGGMAWATVDGLALPVVANPKYRLSKFIREDAGDMGGDWNYLEKPQVGMIGFQCRAMPGLSLADFEGMSGVACEMRLNSGFTVTGTDMWCTSAIEVNGADGTFDLEFHGNDVVIT